MSLRKALLIPLVISLLLFGYFSGDVINSLNDLLRNVQISIPYVIVIGLATMLQLIGHGIRAYKSSYIFRNVKESSTRFQFRALTIGYLFNTILPFRLGELIRSRIIAGAMNISFSLAFALIILERAIDALILGAVSLILIVAISPMTNDSQLYFSLSLVIVGIILLGLLSLLAIPQSHVRRVFYRVSTLFNETVMNGFRFKAWSIIYGLQKTILHRRTILRYLLLSLASWATYFLSMYLIVVYFFGSLGSLARQAAAAIAPYFGVAVPAGPASLGTFSTNTQAAFQGFGSSAADTVPFLLTCWAVLILPTALIGLLLLLFKTRETLWNRPPQATSPASLSLQNKLDRSDDISAEMSVFLENYFAGNSLSAVVHKLELEDNFKLLKYFKGGSDAITILVSQSGTTVVKKIIPLEFEDRLRAQFDWLRTYRNTSGIVQVYDSATTDAYYTIDMSYDPEDLSLFEYVHSRPLHKSQSVIDETWDILDKNVYKTTSKASLHAKKRNDYIAKHIYGCLEKAGAVDPEIIRATVPDTLRVNGHDYDNLHIILKKIQAHPQAWADIATYAESKRVHGDVIIDNLLVNKKTDQVLIIDPAPDGNIINGKVFDFGKNMQSLYCGYEFLLRDESPVYLRDDNTIDYADASSNQYAKLCEYVRSDLAPRYLSESEQKAMLFHAAALFIRRLKHQVYYTPGNSLKFYAVGVKTLNDFLAQYD